MYDRTEMSGVNTSVRTIVSEAEKFVKVRREKPRMKRWKRMSTMAGSRAHAAQRAHEDFIRRVRKEKRDVEGIRSSVNPLHAIVSREGVTKPTVPYKFGCPLASATQAGCICRRDHARRYYTLTHHPPPAAGSQEHLRTRVKTRRQLPPKDHVASFFAARNVTPAAINISPEASAFTTAGGSCGRKGKEASYKQRRQSEAELLESDKALRISDVSFRLHRHA